MGFLHARPKTDRGVARAARIHQFKVPPLPDIGRGQYVADAFAALNIGEIIPFTEIDAYVRLTGKLAGDVWAAEVVRAMSVEYLTGKNMGEDPFSYSPMELQDLE